MTMEAGNENVSLLSESSSIDGNAPELQRLNFRSKTSSRHLRDLHILSFTFLFVFLAYAAAQNLESSVNSEKNLGTTSLGILYLSFTVCSFVATPIVRRLGSKNSLILGTSGYWLFIAANLFPSWYTMVPASLYLGFTASIIWVAEGTYLTFAARGHATECNLPEGAVLGNFNGEFWGMFASTQVIGNLLSLVLLKTGTEGKSTSGTTLLFAVFLGSMTLGTILAFFLSKQTNTKAGVMQSGNDSCLTVGDQLKATFVPLLDKRMLLLIPLLVYSGLEQAFVWAEFTKYVVEPAIGVAGVGGVMAIFGATDAVSSLVAGRLTTGLLSISSITCTGILFQALVLLRLWLSHSFGSSRASLINIVVMAAAWGAGDGVFNTQTNALLAILFPHDTEAAFSQLKIWQSGAISVVFFVSPHIAFTTMLAALAITLFISLVGLSMITFYVGKAVPQRS
uniref:UNC93-like protein 3 n=1 Tax=Araucaria cunninghamii TaxID=56994 RepID=A0A0D6QZA9_ARACU